jgi:hypothetical protein
MRDKHVEEITERALSPILAKFAYRKEFGELSY